jgi:hypothetical protein
LDVFRSDEIVVLMTCLLLWPLSAAITGMMTLLHEETEKEIVVMLIPALGDGHWSQIGGTPRTGLHAQRIPWNRSLLLPDMALWDVLGTVLVAWCMAPVFGMDVWRLLAVLMLFAAVLHCLLRVDTWSSRVLLF